MIGVRPPPKLGPDSGILRIADAQAYIIYPIALQILLLLMFFLLDGIGSGIATLLVLVCLLTAAAIKGYRLLAALGNEFALPLSFVAFLPVVGLAVLVPANSAAGRKLRAAGLKVGPFGVSKAERDTLRAELARESGL